MARYAGFGLQLECDFELPELLRTTESSGPIWCIESRSEAMPHGSFVAFGTDAVHGEVRVHASRSGDTFRLVFDDTGAFDVSVAERRIRWYPGVTASEPAVRADLLGRVMALVAHADGALALHASAVAIDGEAIALLGPKHAGKSTLALALVRGGARLLTDDTLVVRLDERGNAFASPGVQRMRLWDDSARALGLPASDRAGSGSKPTIDALPEDRLERADVPLAACYVVQAGAPDREREAVTRAAMSQVQAAMSCVRFSKLGPLVGGGEGGVLLDRAARLSAAVPIFVAEVCRDLTRLDDIAAAILAWHDRTARAAAPVTW